MPRNALADVRIGVISFSDGRKRVHDGLAPEIAKHQDVLVAQIRELGAEVVQADEIVWTPRMAVQAAKKLTAADVAAVVFNIPAFSFPNFAALAATVLHKPVAILSPGEAGLPGMGGMLAAAGALRQIGLFEDRIWGAYDSASTRLQLDAFCRGAGAAHTLRGQVYGQIGGRSIGMLTGVSSSPAEWLRVFGVDIDHADQSEILRIAETVPQEERARAVDWLESSLRSVNYAEGSKLTRETLEYQAACAIAVKRIIAERQFDFVGIKCHYDMSEYYCTQCLSAAFLPCELDWDGPRRAQACACEADGDAALTMQILQLISGQSPLFLDLRHYDSEQELWTLCNCGGQAVHYARRSDDEAENLKSVDLVPVIPKYGGVGAHVSYLGAPGAMTFARIIHDDEQPALLAFTGEAVEARPEWVQKSCPAWPHIFADLKPDADEILTELHANHIHAVAGDWMDALELFADVVEIPFIGLE
jgi:L-fucose/D-arabinose isomerase